MKQNRKKKLLVGLLDGRLVGLLGWLVCLFVGCLVSWMVGRLVDLVFVFLVDWLVPVYTRPISWDKVRRNSTVFQLVRRALGKPDAFIQYLMLRQSGSLNSTTRCSPRKIEKTSLRNFE